LPVELRAVLFAEGAADPRQVRRLVDQGADPLLGGACKE
jgi:hypothetical protein